MLSQQKVNTHLEAQKRLQKELEKAKKMVNGVTQRDIDLAELREEIEKIYNAQAQTYIDKKVAERESELAEEYENKFLKRLAVSISGGNPNAIPTVDMKDDDTQRGSNLADSLMQTPSAKMGTRKHNKEFGGMPNTIKNRASNESSVEPSQFRF